MPVFSTEICRNDLWKAVYKFFHSVVWIHAPVISKSLPKTIVFICYVFAKIFKVPSLYAKWWLKAPHSPSSVFQNASPVIILLQHTSTWSSYSTPLYLNYYSYYHFPYSVTPKSSRFYSPLNAAKQTQESCSWCKIECFHIYRLETVSK